MFSVSTRLPHPFLVYQVLSVSSGFLLLSLWVPLWFLRPKPTEVFHESRFLLCWNWFFSICYSQYGRRLTVSCKLLDEFPFYTSFLCFCLSTRHVFDEEPVVKSCRYAAPCWTLCWQSSGMLWWKCCRVALVLLATVVSLNSVRVQATEDICPQFLGAGMTSFPTSPAYHVSVSEECWCFINISNHEIALERKLC
jgi:hypothetical protein